MSQKKLPEFPAFKKELYSSNKHLLFQLKIVIKAAFIVIILSGSLFASDSDELKLFNRIKKIPVSDCAYFEKESSSFLQKYPGSRYIPDMKLLQAERQKDVDLALESYRSIVSDYPSFTGRDYALFRICQIYDLKSRWSDLQSESERAIRIFPNGKYAMEYRLMKATSLMMLEDFQGCREECIIITEKSHDFEILARSTRLMAEAERKRSGNSRSYISILGDLATGFDESSIAPSVLYALGRYYEQKKDKDRAYSAYSDLIKKFPEAPEADLALSGIDSLKKEKPVFVKYIPDSRTINEADAIDIEPEYVAENRVSGSWYSVSIGPFSKRRDAEKILSLLKDYDELRIVKTGAGYAVFTGRFADTDEALSARIRLAEEFGINGAIVRVSEDKSKSYIYGD